MVSLKTFLPGCLFGGETIPWRIDFFCEVRGGGANILITFALSVQDCVCPGYWCCIQVVPNQFWINCIKWDLNLWPYMSPTSHPSYVRMFHDLWEQPRSCMKVDLSRNRNSMGKDNRMKLAKISCNSVIIQKRCKMVKSMVVFFPCPIKCVYFSEK